MAGTPRKKLRQVQDLKIRVDAILQDLQSAMPPACRGEPSDGDSLVALGWKWSARSIMRTQTDLSFLVTQLAGKALAVHEGPNQESRAGEPDGE
jgi:hypothetical protein